MNIRPIEDRRPSKSLGLWPAHIKHGTESGYNAHRYRKDGGCDSCREGHRLYTAEKKREREERLARGEKVTHPGSKPKPVEHGTERGYQQHRRQKEDACEACKSAWSARMAADRRRRKDEMKSPKRISIPTKLLAAMYWAIADKETLAFMDDEIGKDLLDQIVQQHDEETNAA